MSNKLFRKEAIDHKNVNPLNGDIALPHAFPLKLLIIILLLLIIAIISFFVIGSYTERKTAMGYLTPINGVVKVYAPISGTIDNLQITAGQKVVENQPLITITETSSDDVESYGSQTKASLESQLQLLDTQELLIEQDYQQRNYQVSNKIDNIKNNIKISTAMLSSQNAKTELLSQTHSRYANVIEGAIAPSEIDSVKQQVIDSSLIANTYLQSLNDLQSRLDEANNQLTLNKNAKQQQLNLLDNKRTLLKQDLLELEHQTNRIIKTSVTGIITTLNVHPAQFVTPSTHLVTITPENNALKATLLIPPHDIGFIEIGDDVTIRYDAFPYQKFGQGTGTVKAISKTTMSVDDFDNVEGFSAPYPMSDTFYLVDVAISEQFFKVNGIDKPLETGMTLSVDIKKDDRKLYEWLLEPLLSIEERN